jgi:DNA-binding GntR family transcriptional regulator
VDCSGSPRLATLLDVISSAHLVTQAIQRHADDDLQRSILQHGDVIIAICNGDASLAESAMRSHILAARYAARRIAD